MEASMKKLTEVTPKSVSCPPMGTCPAIFRTDDGKYLIIGAVADANDQASTRGRVGDGEVMIEVPAELIDDIRR